MQGSPQQRPADQADPNDDIFGAMDLEEVDLGEAMRTYDESSGAPSHGEVPKFVHGQDGNLVRIEAPQKSAAAASAKSAQKGAQDAAGETPAPGTTEDADHWRRIAYEEARKNAELRKKVELSLRLRQNPNDPVAIDALMNARGVDDMPGLLQAQDEVDEMAQLEAYLAGEDADQPQASKTAQGRKGQPQSPPQARQPDASGLDPKSIEEEQKALDASINKLTQDGYGEAVVFEFLGWLDGGKPGVEDLFYAYLANMRRLGRPVQKSRKTPAEAFGHAATAVTGQSGRPTVDGVVDPSMSEGPGYYIDDPNNLF